MPVLIGFLIGDTFGRVVFSRLLGLMALWVAIPLVAGRLVAANVSQTAGVVATVVVPLAVLIWALYRPGTSTLKLTLLDGVFAWCRIVALVCAGRLVVKLFAAHWAIGPLAAEWRWIATMAAALAISVALGWWVARDAEGRMA